jgi:RNA polymerase sigma factor (sigma-70 family)
LSNTASLAELYQRHWDELVRYVARTFGGGQPDPEDAAQAAFAQYAALSQPGAIENPRAFLFRSAHNFVIDQRRRAVVRTRFADTPDAAFIVQTTDEMDAERVLSAKERLRILDEAIRTLQPQQREVLILNRIHELSYAEIARRKGISQTQAKRLVALALVACQRALRKADTADKKGC